LRRVLNIDPPEAERFICNLVLELRRVLNIDPPEAERFTCPVK
jgi:hypothetical protein